jgi:hypothetical protein
MKSATIENVEPPNLRRQPSEATTEKRPSILEHPAGISVDIRVLESEDFARRLFT